MTENVASRRQYASLGRHTLRLKQGGGQGVLFRLMWPRCLKYEDDDSRGHYLPAVTLGGKKVPVGWGNWLYVIAVPGAVKVRAVQGGSPENAAHFAGPESLRHSVTVAVGEAAECEYFPTVRSKFSSEIPRMRSRIRLWDRSPYLRALAYSGAFGAFFFGLVALARLLN